MIVLIVRKTGQSDDKQKAYLLKNDNDIEVVRQIGQRLGVYLHDFEFDLQGKLPF